MSNHLYFFELDNAYSYGYFDTPKKLWRFGSISFNQYYSAVDSNYSMSKNKKPKKKQSLIPTCIFCKSTPVTEEHLWPQWVEKEFSKVGGDKHVVNNYQTLSHDGSRTQFSSKVLNRNIIRKAVKKVCASCNNGWMSRIETESKEIITSLILDQSISLGRDEQIKLAKWGILKSIIGECLSPLNNWTRIAQKVHL